MKHFVEKGDISHFRYLMIYFKLERNLKPSEGMLEWTSADYHF